MSQVMGGGVMKKILLFVLFGIQWLGTQRTYGLIHNCTNQAVSMEGEWLGVPSNSNPPYLNFLNYDSIISNSQNYLNQNYVLSNEMTKERFLELIDKATNVYQPFFNKLGAKLTVNKRWDDNKEDISSDQWPNGNWRVTMTGGFARHPLITDDGFLMALCHEIGHHLGGTPRYENNKSWAATEGQADYFASLKCFKRLIENDDNIAIVSEMKIDSSVTLRCQNIYKSPTEVAICQRTALAGFSVANFIASRSDTPIIKFETPDQSTVAKTIESGPKPQCRLDTFYQGTLCNVSIDEELSSDNPRIGTCNLKDGHAFGYRPQCWYSPINEI